MPEPSLPAIQASDIPGAVKATQPDKLQPQLATLSKKLPTTGDWIYEVKLDGYRIMARIKNGKTRLVSRNGHDWTERMKPIAKSLDDLGLQSAWLDGEVVVLNNAGIPDFNALQNAFDSARPGAIVYFLFDLPFFDGYDLRGVLLHVRRDVLRRLLQTKRLDRVRYSEDFAGDAASVLKGACEMGLEGIIAKRRDAPYVSERTSTWLKLKCSERQEFVVLGYVDRADSRNEVGSLLLGYYDDAGKLCYAGSVGTGWDSATAADLRRRLATIEVDTPSLDPQTVKPGGWSKRKPGGERWVRPELVVEVSFSEWTPEGHVRHPAFRGIRTDEPAQEIRREVGIVPATSTASGKAGAAG
ncbi:MAG TPA: non-homologous end-joining DNA ligase [Burkholderiaceae bacterium]|nr:non-homologous end-joining DNA ligase [Burkholderiaceae bacterium]